MSLQGLLRSGGRKRIGMDVDDVLALTCRTIIDLYNSIHGTHTSIEDLTAWDADKWKHPMTRPEFTELYNEAWTQKWAKIAPSIPPWVLGRLTDTYEVEITTRRPPEQEVYLRRWLGMYFPGIPVKAQIVDSLDAKLRAGYDIMFDDANHLAEELIKKNDGRTTLFLVDQPWNRSQRYDLRSPDVIGVKTLGAGIELLMRNGHAETARATAKSRMTR